MTKENKDIKSRSSKNPELDESNLHKNSNFGRESFAQKSGVRIPAPVKKFFVLFILISNSPCKTAYLCF